MRNWMIGQLAMYAAYHRDARNRATHHVGVPMIVFSLLIIAATVPLGGGVTLAAVLLGPLLFVYLLTVPLMGVVAVAFYGCALLLAREIASLGLQTALIAFAAAFVVGWIIQLVGHAFEGRRPALIDNFLQIFMAPAFLILEMLFALRMEKRVRADIEERMVAHLPSHGAQSSEQST